MKDKSPALYETDVNTRREACLLRKAIRELLREYPQGLTRTQICDLLSRRSGFQGTRRNLVFLSQAVLQALTDEGKIESGTEAGATIFKSPG